MYKRQPHQSSRAPLSGGNAVCLVAAGARYEYSVIMMVKRHEPLRTVRPNPVSGGAPASGPKRHHPGESGRLLTPAAANPKSHFRLFDPRLTGGFRDEYMGQLRCMAARPPRHHRSQLLTARAAGRLFCGGDGAGGDDGRINAWSTSQGTMLCAQSLDSPVICMCVVCLLYTSPSPRD